MIVDYHTLKLQLLGLTLACCAFLIVSAVLLFAEDDTDCLILASTVWNTTRGFN